MTLRLLALPLHSKQPAYCKFINDKYLLFFFYQIPCVFYLWTPALHTTISTDSLPKKGSNALTSPFLSLSLSFRYICVMRTYSIYSLLFFYHGKAFHVRVDKVSHFMFPLHVTNFFCLWKLTSKLFHLLIRHVQIIFWTHKMSVNNFQKYQGTRREGNRKAKKIRSLW